VDVRLDAEGGCRIGQPISGDTVSKVLRYVNFEPDALLKIYQRKFSESDLSTEQQTQLLAELSAGLEGYTYLEE